VLAANTKWRCAIIPSPPEPATKPSADHANAQGGLARRMSWARLLNRAFGFEIDHCRNCGGSLKIVADIEDPPVILKYENGEEVRDAA
jgi:hypothetical protein